MNKHYYKVIFDPDLQRSIIVSEWAKSRSKPSKMVCIGDVVVFDDRMIGGSVQKVRSVFKGFVKLKNTLKTDRTFMRLLDTRLKTRASIGGSARSADCRSEMAGVEKAYAGYFHNSTQSNIYGYPVYTRNNLLYAKDADKVAGFASEYDLQKALKDKNIRDIANAYGWDENTLRNVEAWSEVGANIATGWAGHKLATNTKPPVIPKEANANSKLPPVGEIKEYDLKSFNYEAHNAKVYQDLKMDLKTQQSANSVIEHLQQHGKLPDEYVTKNQAKELYGWKSGKPFKEGQIGGDIYLNTKGYLPNKQGRIWYEADIGIDNNIARSKQQGTRLLYSNDGLLYISTDHYKERSFKEIGRWK